MACIHSEMDADSETVTYEIHTEVYSRRLVEEVGSDYDVAVGLLAEFRDMGSGLTYEMVEVVTAKRVLIVGPPPNPRS